MSIDNRINIAFVADTLHSASGGAILSGEYVVNRLRRDNTVVSVGTDGDDALPAFQLPLRAMRKSGFVMARPDRSILTRAFAQVDVVHLQFPFWLSFAALEEARKLGLPVVAGFHVQPENALFNVGVHSQWLNDRVYHALVNRFYNKVDGVICPTPPGSSALHEAFADVVFKPFHFSPDGKTFTMEFSKVSHSDSPKQTNFVSLSGRETKRVCVTNAPGSA